MLLLTKFLYVSLVQREANQQSEGGIWSGFTGWQWDNDDGAGGSAAWKGNAEGGDPKVAGASANSSDRDPGEMMLMALARNWENDNIISYVVCWNIFKIFVYNLVKDYWLDMAVMCAVVKGAIFFSPRIWRTRRWQRRTHGGSSSYSLRSSWPHRPEQSRRPRPRLSDANR